MIGQLPYAYPNPAALRGQGRTPPMLSQEQLPPPPLLSGVNPCSPISLDSIFTRNPRQTYPFPSTQLTLRHLFAVHGQNRMGGCSRILEMEDGFDDLFGDGDEDVDGDEIVPLMSMKNWFEKKPCGFGEDKVYDTSIEDKLLEEIEQGKRAQLANINNMKNNPLNPKPEEEQATKKKASEDVPSGFCVRVTNLPKKKNILKDLKLAFKGVSGVVNIIPVVSGNKKTRDPICKGFAFVYFKSEEEAYRFVQTFSRESLAFGRIQKQIKCEIANANFSKTTFELTVDETNNACEQAVPHLPGEVVAESDIDDYSSDSHGQIFSEEYEGVDYEHVAAQCDDYRESVEVCTLLEIGNIDSIVPAEEQTSSLKHEEKIHTKGRKMSSKRKKQKFPNGRLRVREKAVLSDVFSKYLSNAVLSTGKQS